MHDLLIVDDEWIIREGLTKTIPWNDWNINVVGAARNGEEALHLLEQQPVSILLTDIRMPGLSGLELLEKARAIIPGLKVILLTGHDEFSYAQSALKLGADDFILKPTDIKELEKAVLTVTDKLIHEKTDTHSVISLLIGNMIKDNDDSYIDHIEKLHTLRTKFGFVNIQGSSQSNMGAALPPCDDRFLIENNPENQIYLYHNVKNQSDWENYILALKKTYREPAEPIQIKASLVTSSLQDLPHIYKQAKVASNIIYNDALLTVYKYEDTTHSLDMEKALMYIDQHFTTSITLADLAYKHQMSSGYFSKLFKQHTGMKFIEYITNKRLERAKDLLKTTNLKGYEVAYEAGYTEPRYFNQLFRKHVGCTPIEYRKRTLE